MISEVSHLFHGYDIIMFSVLALIAIVQLKVVAHGLEQVLFLLTKSYANSVANSIKYVILLPIKFIRAILFGISFLIFDMILFTIFWIIRWCVIHIYHAFIKLIGRLGLTKLLDSLKQRVVNSLINFFCWFSVKWIGLCDKIFNKIKSIFTLLIESKTGNAICKVINRIRIPKWFWKKLLWLMGVSVLLCFMYYLYLNRDTEAVRLASNLFTDPSYIVFLTGLFLMAFAAIKKASYTKSYEYYYAKNDFYNAKIFKKKKSKIYVNKVFIIFATFLVLAFLFIQDHGFVGFIEHFMDFEEHAKAVKQGVTDLIEHGTAVHDPNADHSSGHRRIDLPFEMIQLFLGFEFIEWVVASSRLNKVLGRVIKSIVDLLWAVFILSSFMDNILMALVGASIVVAVWRGISNVPIKVLIAVICAANLGGAFSFIGDTTTIIIYLLKDGEATPMSLASAIFGSLAAFFYWLKYAQKGVTYPESEKGNVQFVRPLMWIVVLGILGILIGNVAFHQPGIGLFIGLCLGASRAEVWKYMKIKEFVHHLQNGGQAALFITFILAGADMLNLEILKPLLNLMSTDFQIYVLGKLSGILDNIPLTSMACRLEGLDWSLLAYSVGFGGSMFFFSSSAGIAVAMSYSKASDSKAWLPHTLRVIIAYNVGFFVQILFRDYVFDAFSNGWLVFDPYFAIAIILLTYIVLAYNLRIIYAPGLGILRAKVKDVKQLMEDIELIDSPEAYHQLPTEHH